MLMKQQSEQHQSHLKEDYSKRIMLNEKYNHNTDDAYATTTPSLIWLLRASTMSSQDHHQHHMHFRQRQQQKQKQNTRRCPDGSTINHRIFGLLPSLEEGIEVSIEQNGIPL